MARTLEHFRKRRKIPVCSWEMSIPGTWRKRDGFGFIDLVALDEERRMLLAVQVTSYSNISARLHKIQNDCQPAALAWLNLGGKIEIWGWKEYGKTEMGGDFPGCRWRPRIVPVTRSSLINDQKPLGF